MISKLYIYALVYTQYVIDKKPVRTVLIGSRMTRLLNIISLVLFNVVYDFENKVIEETHQDSRKYEILFTMLLQLHKKAKILHIPLISVLKYPMQLAKSSNNTIEFHIDGQMKKRRNTIAYSVGITSLFLLYRRYRYALKPIPSVFLPWVSWHQTAPMQVSLVSLWTSPQWTKTINVTGNSVEKCHALSFYLVRHLVWYRLVNER